MDGWYFRFWLTVFRFAYRHSWALWIVNALEGWQRCDMCDRRVFAPNLHAHEMTHTGAEWEKAGYVRW